MSKPEPVSLRVYKLRDDCRPVRYVCTQIFRAVLPKSRGGVSAATLSAIEPTHADRAPCEDGSIRIQERKSTRNAGCGDEMLRDDSGNGGGRPGAPRNVLGERLEVCSITPMTGFFRDGCCNTSPEDIGSHTVCAVMTAAFLAFSKSRGNDLSTPVPEFGFRGLKPGDRWCLCAPRWQEALEAGQAPRVVLRATHEGALDYCTLADP